MKRADWLFISFAAGVLTTMLVVGRWGNAEKAIYIMPVDDAPVGAHLTQGKRVPCPAGASGPCYQTEWVK